MTTLTNGEVPFVLDVRTGTNTGIDFVRVVVRAIAMGYLVPGDFLVVDGARVHFTRNTRDALLQFMVDHGVRFSS
jgi:hypothetical protein